MDKNLHDIERLFHTALNDNEEAPSASSWESIDKRLDKESISTIKRKYRNLKRITILLLLLLGSAGGYYFYNNPANQNTNYIVNSSSPVKSNTAVTPGQTVNKLSEVKKPVTANTTNQIQNELIQNSKEKNGVQQPLSQPPVFTSNQDLTNDKSLRSSATQTSVLLPRKKKINSSTPSSYKITTVSAEQEDVIQTNAVSNGDNKLDETSNIALKKIKPGAVEIPHLQNTAILGGIKLSQAFASLPTSPIGNKKITATKNKQPNPSKFSFTPFFSPDIAWYQLENDKNENDQDNAKEIEEEEHHEFSSTFGALIDYKISKHWGLQSGITLSNTNISVEPKTIYAKADNAGNVKYLINSSSGYGYVLPSYSNNPAAGDSLYAFTTTHSLQYIGIPLAATYQFSKGKFTFNALVGLSVNILASAKIETSIENGIDNSTETVNKLYGLKNLYLGGMAGLGVDYKLTNKTALTLSPVMRFALSPINKDAAVKSYPMSLGFLVGYKINF